VELACSHQFGSLDREIVLPVQRQDRAKQKNEHQKVVPRSRDEWMAPNAVPPELPKGGSHRQPRWKHLGRENHVMWIIR
jgi:hypothetical protein